MKQKTKSAAKKRIKVTGSGKMMFQKAGKSHLLTSKSKRQKKSNRLGQAVAPGHKQTFKRLLNI